MISAYIVTFNRPELLKRAIISIINQSLPVEELVIVDDHSSSETKEVVDKFILESKVTIVYYFFEKNVGACKARNKAIELARGKYIAGLDDDDEWHPDRLMELYDAYTSDQSLVSSRNLILTDNGNKKITFSPLLVCKKQMLCMNYVGNQILTETYKIRQIGGFDENLSAAQDYDLYLRLIETFGCAKVLKTPLQTVYQNHRKGSITLKAYKGYLDFYFKHRKKFSTSNKISQIFRMKQIKGSDLPISFLFGSPSFHIFLKMVKFIVLRNVINNHKTF